MYVAYLPHGGTITLDLAAIDGQLTARWFNPRDGKFGAEFNATAIKQQQFIASNSNDWVLLIITAASNSK